MQLIKRRHGSQRSYAPLKATFEVNWAGQGGSTELVFRTEDNMYHIIKFDSRAEVRELLSQAHIIEHNYKEPKNG